MKNITATLLHATHRLLANHVSFKNKKVLSTNEVGLHTPALFSSTGLGDALLRQMSSKKSSPRSASESRRRDADCNRHLNELETQ